jgi:hypothetical protein
MGNSWHKSNPNRRISHLVNPWGFIVKALRVKVTVMQPLALANRVQKLFND